MVPFQVKGVHKRFRALWFLEGVGYGLRLSHLVLCFGLEFTLLRFQASTGLGQLRRAG